MFWLLAMAAPAMAFEVEANDVGTPVRWDHMPMTYQVNLDGAPDIGQEVQWATIIEDSFAAWTAVERTRVVFENIGPTQTMASRDDGVNAVLFDTVWDDDPDVGARTHIWTTSTGTPLGFDIRINPYINWSTDGSGPDIQAALTHEVGHAIGLDHSAEESATMFYALGSNDMFRRDLSADDEAGVVFLYSHVDLEVPPALSCDSAGRAPWTSLLLLPLLLRRRSSSLGGAR